ncbi:hypothetical protein HPB49_016017 [Dermacentor silvarum]|uniref:Uncharacterized protein n=1 Tax=Dermacentor silvarum TaxID=543639 RepID=A0ACB8CRW3_DERSI|nr:hypothetical protein HPB49_016017 [Dermacentor silvarum]
MKSVLSSGRCSVSVWGAISRRGLGPLVRIDGSFTAAYTRADPVYLGALRIGWAFPGRAVPVQPDRSPVHMAHRVTTALENLAVPTYKRMGLIKSRLSKRKLSRATADALWAVISEEWELFALRPE